MKRHIFMLIIVILAISLVAVSAVAADTRKHFSDVDTDGICDNLSNSTAYTDSNNDGVCGNWDDRPVEQAKVPLCRNSSNAYTDADEDGICDNRETQTEDDTQSCPQGGKNCGNAENQKRGQGKGHRKGS